MCEWNDKFAINDMNFQWQYSAFSPWLRGSLSWLYVLAYLTEPLVSAKCWYVTIVCITYYVFLVFQVFQLTVKTADWLKHQLLEWIVFCFTAFEHTISQNLSDNTSIFSWRKRNWAGILIILAVLFTSDICTNSRKCISNVNKLAVT